MNINALKGRRVLIVGMAGTGKTFVSQFLCNQGIKAFDGDEVEGLSGWFDEAGSKVLPKDLSAAGLKGLEWNWNEDVLSDLLKRHQQNGILLFGVSSNWHKLLYLFDKVFFLNLDGVEIRKRLLNKNRRNDYGKNETGLEEILKHIKGFRKFALKHGAIGLDATKSPQEIYLEIVHKSQLKPNLPAVI